MTWEYLVGQTLDTDDFLQHPASFVVMDMPRGVGVVEFSSFGHNLMLTFGLQCLSSLNLLKLHLLLLSILF